MRKLFRALRYTAVAVVAMAAVGMLAFGAAYLYIEPQLPNIERLKDVRLQVPLRVYTSDGLLMAEYGEKRRIPVAYEDIPALQIKAFLAAEDDRFFQHPGVDYQGLIRAAIELVRTGQKRQGGSTITMQVARNFFLSRRKTYLRKLTEIFLALKIDRELTKPQVLELYLNKIYLGHRAYGIGAAAQVYYGKPLDQLTVGEMAMIAGLPKAPSRYNPITDPSRARIRRNYVLGRMLALGFIDQAVYKKALAENDSATLHAPSIQVRAPYVAEMVRADMVQRFGDAAYTDGYQVYTTIEGARQHDATGALRDALLQYDWRHGYRGPERKVDLADYPTADAQGELLQEMPTVGGLQPALVLDVADRAAKLRIGDGSEVNLDWDGMSWARPYVSVNRRGPAPKKAADVLKPGDIVRLKKLDDGHWKLAEVPAVEGALVSLRPDDGSIVALVGGFDYYRSKFNRAIQAERQPGSSFKPFIYSAALHKGYTAASVINDAPVVFNDPALESTWRPENYSGHFFGPTRLRVGLVDSRNLVAVRLLQNIGVSYAIDYAQRFGFDPKQLPRNLSLALGSTSVTPLQMVTGYAVFANGGYRIKPYLIKSIADESGNVVFRADPAVVCAQCGAAGGQPQALTADARNAPGAPAGSAGPSDGARQSQVLVGPPRPAVNLAKRVISPQNAYIMTSMMQDVIRHGTGRHALALHRTDLAGKTGTTNDQQDAWFCGFDRALVAAAWVGFDQVQPLGAHETGAIAALPAWMAYMGAALKGMPAQLMEEPPGLVTVRIDPATGLLARPDQSGAIFETFRLADVPKRTAPAASAGEVGGPGPTTPGHLF
ncbi:MAG: penicillin-binding protein 1A [Gammaproteobacteria bacterium]